MSRIIGPDIDPRFETQVPVYFLNGLGLAATGKRTLKDITPYLGLFPVPLGDDEPYNKGEYVRTGKVLGLIEERVNKYYSDTTRFANEYVAKGLDKNSPVYVKEVCKRLYQWLVDFIQYKQDRAGREELRRPARAVKEAKTGIDCDCFTYFISTVLKNLGIAHNLRIIAVGTATAYHHIYVVVPNSSGSLEPYRDKHRYTVVDPVLDTFDQEPDGITAYHDYPMRRTNAMNGLAGAGLDDLYKMMTDTRSAMQKNPQSYIAGGINPAKAIPLLDQAIQAWYTPQRDAVLARLAKYDNTIYTGMNGVPMSGLLQNIANAAKQVVNNVVTTVKTAVTDPKKLINDTIDHAKEIVDQVIDYGRTGALFIPRKAFMALVELNVRGLGTELKKGLANQDTNVRLRRVWEGDLGGDFNSLTNAINKGAGNPFLLGLRGLNGDPVTVASLVASAGGILAAIEPILKTIKGFVSAASSVTDIFSQGKGIVASITNKDGKPPIPNLPTSLLPNGAVITPVFPTSPITNSPTSVISTTPTVNPTPQYAAPTGVNPNYTVSPPQTVYAPPTGVNPNYTDTSTPVQAAQNNPTLVQPPAPESSGKTGNSTLLWVGGSLAAGFLLYKAINSNKKNKPKTLNGLNGHKKPMHKPHTHKKHTKKGKAAKVTF